MKIKMLAALAAAAVCAMAFAGVATAKKDAKTNVSIEAETTGFFGFVSSNKSSCESNRKVKLYKVKHGPDKLIGKDTAQPNQDASQWSIGTEKTGKFYAKTKAVDGCKAGQSPTIHSEN